MIAKMLQKLPKQHRNDAEVCWVVKSIRSVQPRLLGGAESGRLGSSRGTTGIESRGGFPRPRIPARTASLGLPPEASIVLAEA